MTIDYRLQIVDYNYWISLRDLIFSFTCGVIKPRGLPTQAFTWSPCAHELLGSHTCSPACNINVPIEFVLTSLL